MGIYEDLLRKLGLSHLKDNPDGLQEAILKELGLEDVKDDPEAMNRRMAELLKEKQDAFERIKKDLGSLIQKHKMKRNN